MTVMQERTFETIKRLPDERIYYILQILEGMEELALQAVQGSMTKEQKAYENLQRYRKGSDVEIDYKAELAQAFEKKYAALGIESEQKRK